MKLGKGLPPPTKNDKRMLLVSSGILLATCLFVVFAVTRNKLVTSENLGVVQPQAAGTVLPVDNTPKTPYPAPLPLTGEMAGQIRAVQQMVVDCKDYSAERRDQMNLHIQWLLEPSTLPQSMLPILGSNSTGRLIFGMATYTLSDWGQHAKAPDSCLLTIGKKLNELLATTDEEHFSQFDG